MRYLRLLLVCAVGFLLPRAAHAAVTDVQMSGASTTWDSEVLRLLEKFKASNDIPSLKEALGLLESAGPPPAALEAAASALFKVKLLRLLQTFNALDAKIIPRFDLENPPSLSIAPPAEYHGLVGVAPEAVHDPKERAAYEKNIATNQAKLAQYSFQVDLRAADARCTEIFSDHLAHRPRKASKKAVSQLIEASIRSKKRAAALEALWARKSG
jgi:hypothetical protein